MDQDLDQFSNLEALQRHNLLETIAGARTTIVQHGDATYPGEEKPMSWHLDRLEKAVLDGDLKIVNEYGSGAILFPYQNVVRIYTDSIGK